MVKYHPMGETNSEHRAFAGLQRQANGSTVPMVSVIPMWHGGWFIGPRGCSWDGTDPGYSAGKKPVGKYLGSP